MKPAIDNLRHITSYSPFCLLNLIMPSKHVRRTTQGQKGIAKNTLSGVTKVTNPVNFSLIFMVAF
jgi:hypothetical protein